MSRQLSGIDSQDIMEFSIITDFSTITEYQQLLSLNNYRVSTITDSPITDSPITGSVIFVWAGGYR